MLKLIPRQVVSLRAIALLSALQIASIGSARAQYFRVIKSPFESIAGNTGTGSADGVGRAARFHFPQQIAVDGTGNAYVADSENDVIRKVTPDGRVSTFAGRPEAPGRANGQGMIARFAQPNGVAVDRAGMVYVADTGNGLIRKITPDGAVTTLAGTYNYSPGPTSLDGPGNVARFSSPTGVAVDNAGYVYVADSFNFTIRKIAPDGMVTTLAGTPGVPGSDDGVGNAAQFRRPMALAVDRAGIVYVVDTGNHSVRKITPDGAVSTFAGPTPSTEGNAGAVDGFGTDARFRGPGGVALDEAGNLYVTDDGTIRKISTDRFVTTYAGAAGISGSDDGPVADARFNVPVGIAFDPAGNILIAEKGNNEVRKISAAVVSTLAGLAGGRGAVDGTGVDARFAGPAALAVGDDGTVYVGDNFAVRKITVDGVVTTYAGSLGKYGYVDGAGAAARFSGMQGLAVDRSGNVFVADGNNVVRKVTPAGVVTTVAGKPGVYGTLDGPAAVAQFSFLQGIAVDPAGNVYVTTAGTVRKISSNGMVSTFAGVGYNEGSNDGPGAGARFNQPHGLAADRAGNIYVADTGNGTIRKISPVGYVTTVAGTAGNHVGFDEPPGFNQPWALAVDDAGNILVADAGSASSVRRITPAGQVNTLAGGQSGYADRLDGGVLFNSPRAIGVNRAGQIFVADTGNNLIRRGVVGPVSQFLNISTRVEVALDREPPIAGVILAGSVGEKSVLFRAMGPSLATPGARDSLSDPVLELHGADGSLIARNDDWKINDAKQTSQESEIRATTLAPADDRESALIAFLQLDQSYTVVLRGRNGAAGVGLIEAYDLYPPAGILANMSTRGFVGTGVNVLIGGFIIGPAEGLSRRVIVRAIGPSLRQAGVDQALPDPTLRLCDANGAVVVANDNWRETDAAAIEATGVPPTNDAESAVVASLTPGAYTAVVAGKDDQTGVGLVEIYHLR